MSALAAGRTDPTLSPSHPKAEAQAALETRSPLARRKTQFPRPPHLGIRAGGASVPETHTTPCAHAGGKEGESSQTKGHLASEPAFHRCVPLAPP